MTNSGNRIRKALFFYAGLFLIISVTVVGLSGKEESGLKRNQILRGVIQEPSGLTYHPDRGTLIAVGDEGQVVELSLDGEVIAEKVVGGDLEAITADPHRKILYAVEEKEERLFLLDWDTLELKSEIDLKPLAQEAGLSRDRNDGFEAIAFQPAGEGRTTDRLLLGHQHRPVAILSIGIEGNPPELSFLKRIDVDVSEVADLSYDPTGDDLWLLCDKGDKIYKIDESGSILSSRSIPGDAQEGLAFSPSGDFFIADDSGGIFKYGVNQPDGDTSR